MIKFIVLELFILLATLIIGYILYKNIMNAYLNLVTN